MKRLVTTRPYLRRALSDIQNDAASVMYNLLAQRNMEEETSQKKYILLQVKREKKQ